MLALEMDLRLAYKVVRDVSWRRGCNIVFGVLTGSLQKRRGGKWMDKISML